MKRVPKSPQAWLHMLIDREFHPKIRRAKGWEKFQLIMLDFLWHAAVEGNFEKSRRKFIRYSLPMLLKDE